ncbi:MAG: hypothetical protein MUD14_03455 [Hydrococcus sp. Prado102]|jgi:hypothetical protein|nr:hypothetical protein [Hydrococcus sp. Prado102]
MRSPLRIQALKTALDNRDKQQLLQVVIWCYLVFWHEIDAIARSHFIISAFNPFSQSWQSNSDLLRCNF